MSMFRTGRLVLALLALALLTACAGRPQFATLEARVVSSEPIELDEDAQLRVLIEDMTEGALVAETTYSRLGTTPFNVSLRYDANAIDENNSYVLRAHLRRDGRITHVEDEPMAVLTGDAAQGEIEIALEPVRR